MNERLPMSSSEMKRLRRRADDEVSLIDLWLIVAGRRWLVLLIVLATVAGAATLALTRTSLYESRTVIAVGMIGDGRESAPLLLEAPQDLVQRLRATYAVDDDPVRREFPHVSNVTLEQGTSSVQVRVHDVTPQGAQAYAHQMSSDLLAEHAALFEQAIATQRERLESLTRQLGALDAQLGALTGHIEAVQSLDPAQAAVLAVERGKLLSERPVVERQRAELALAVSALRSQPTRLLREPSLPQKPLGPGVAAYLGLGLMLGLMLGILAAFLAAFIGRIRLESANRLV